MEGQVVKYGTSWCGDCRRAKKLKLSGLLLVAALTLASCGAFAGESMAGWDPDSGEAEAGGREPTTAP